MTLAGYALVHRYWKGFSPSFSGIKPGYPFACGVSVFSDSGNTPRQRSSFPEQDNNSRNEGEYPLIAAVAAISPYCSGNSILLRKNDSPATKQGLTVDGSRKTNAP